MSSNKTSNTTSHSSYKKLKKQAKASNPKELKRLQNQKVFKKVAAIGLPVIIVLVIAIIITVNLLKDNGTFIRSQTVMESDHFKVDGAMMTYLFWDTVNRELEGENASFYKMYDLANVFDIDNPSPFTSEDEEKKEEKQTWREYFTAMTTDTMEAMMTYAHYSLSLGKELSKQDHELIDEEIDKIESSASLLGLSLEKYIHSYYGRGVNKDDIRRTLEIMYLSNYGMDMATENSAVTDTELEAYYNNNTESLKCTDYLFFVTGVSGKDNLTEEEQDYYSARAQYIKNATTEDEFIKRVTDYIKEENDAKADDDEEKLNAKELEEYIESELASLRFTAVPFNENSKELDKWIFSSDRKTGDTFLNHTEGYGTYGVVFMLKPAYIPDNWKETAEKELLKEKENNLIESIKNQYKITIHDSNFAVADLAE